MLGHKDYLHQKLLARSLPIDSFRFDFRFVLPVSSCRSSFTNFYLFSLSAVDSPRGNHETPGEWSMAAFPRDVDDLRVVAKHLRDELNYEIDMIV